MGAIIDLPTDCAPFALEVRRESVYLTDATVVNRDVTGSAIHAMSTRYAGPGMFRVARTHLPALAATINIALAHPRVVADESRAERMASSVAELDGFEGPGLTVSTDVLPVYGHTADALLDDGPLLWGPCSTVEILHVDLRAIAVVLADEGMTAR